METIFKLYRNSDQYKGIFSRFLSKISKYDVFMLISIFLIFIILFLTKIVYPFNRYLHWSSEALLFINIKFPSINFLLIFSTLLSSILLIWMTICKDKIRFIIPLGGLCLRLIGSFSQNQIYGNDDLIHIGIIERLRPNPIFASISFMDGTFGSFTINYPGLAFHKFLAIISNIFNLDSTDVLLYFGPILIFICYIPLGDKLIRLNDGYKSKILTGTFFFWFPFVLVQHFGITPFSLLIGLYALMIYLFPFESDKSTIFGFIISIIAILVHILGFYLFISYLLLLILLRIKTTQYRVFFTVTIASIMLSVILIIAFSREIYFGDNNLFYLINNTLKINLFKIIFDKFISAETGFLSVYILPKIKAGGLYLIWYIIQFLLLIISFTSAIIYLAFIRVKQKYNLSNKNKFEDFISYLLLFNSFFLFLALFYGENLVWRIIHFNVLIVFHLLFFCLKNIIQKVNYKIFYAFLFFFLFFSPLIIYYQYSIPTEDSRTVAYWINENKSEFDGQIIVFSDSTFVKSVYAYSEDIISIYWSNFWIKENLTLFFSVFLNSSDFSKPNTILLTITDTCIAYELEYHNINIVDRFAELSAFSDIILIYNNFIIYKINNLKI